MDMRGLATFIADVRRATNNRDEEVKRVGEELAKIRSKFKNTTSLSTYDRKKYVCKLMFIFMLGYEVDFGHMEGVQLLSGTSQSEKLIGYLSITVFLHENHELLTLTTHTVNMDLISGKEFNMSLALAAIANVGGRDFAEAMAQHVLKVLLTPHFGSAVRKRALLTMLRLWRKYREIVEVDPVTEVATRCIADNSLGVVNCALSLILGLMSESNNDRLADVPRHCISIMERIIQQTDIKDAHPDYVYCGVPAPWLQIKTLRLLQHFPCPTHEQLRAKMLAILGKILRATSSVLREAQQQQQAKGAQNRVNMLTAVLVEVVSLVVQWDCSAELLNSCAEILGSLIQKEGNLRYVGLSLMSRLSFAQCAEFSFASVVQQHQRTVVSALHSQDVSIRQRALELLYNMCTTNIADEVVGELLAYLPQSDADFREDLVLMIAILAEKFCSDFTWYVEVIMALISNAGDHISDDIWHRACHIVVNTPPIQKHAAEIIFRALQSPSAHEVLVKVASFVLGEYGYLIALDPQCSPIAQFSALHSKWGLVSDATKAMLLSTYIKFYNLYDDLAVREKVKKALQAAKVSFNMELQQRATEYMALLGNVSDETLQNALDRIPVFELTTNSILERLKERQKGTDRNLWSEKSEKRDVQQAEAAANLRAASLGSPNGQQAASTQPQAVQPAVQTAVAAQEQPPTPPPAATSTPPPETPPDAQESSKNKRNTLDAIFGSEALPPSASRAVPSLPPSVTKQAPAATGTTGVLDDIFAVGTPTPLADTAAVSLERMHKNFIALCTMPRGALFDSDEVAVNVVHEYRVADARLTLTIQNRSSNLPVEQLSLKVMHISPSLMLQSKPNDPTIPPRGSIDVMYAARCLAPFDDYPQLQMTFMLGGVAHSTRIDIPIVVTKFAEPYSVDSVAKACGLWENTLCGNEALALRPEKFPLPRQLDVADVEGLLFQRLRMHTVRISATCVYGIAAHATMPELAPTYTPLLVKVDLFDDGMSYTAATRNPSQVLQQALLAQIMALFAPS